jgi:DNA/RNA-binding protein KIN17
VDRVLKDNEFCAEVELLESSPYQQDGGEILRLDQNDLETVVPKEGKKVRILKGEYRGEIAKLVSADKKLFRATLKLVDNGQCWKM